jgi:choline/ethanolamine kinase
MALNAEQSSEHIPYANELIDSCIHHVPGWDQYAQDDFCIRILTGGLSNSLYIVALIKNPNNDNNISSTASTTQEADSKHSASHCNNRVVVRVYGSESAQFLDRNTEELVSQQLSQQGIGAKIYCTFTHPNHKNKEATQEQIHGRIEAFILGHTLKFTDLHNPIISYLIAKELAKLHHVTVSVPVNKDTNMKNDVEPGKSELFIRIHSWLRAANSINFTADQAKQKLLDELSVSALNEEAVWLEKKLLSLKSRVVFCHNDGQEGNCIFFQPHESQHIKNLAQELPSDISYADLLTKIEGNEDFKQSQLHLIDFEYSGYNYRAFDLANHFCEHYINNSYTQFPFFHIDYKQFNPSENHRKRFIRAYLEERYRLDESQQQANPEEINKLYHDSQWFELASHYQWSLWAIIQATGNLSDQFGFLQYAQQRLQLYYQIKKSLIQSYGE